MNDKQLRYWAHMLDESMGEKGLGPFETVDKFAKDRGLSFAAGYLADWDMKYFPTFEEASAWLRSGICPMPVDSWRSAIRENPERYGFRAEEASDGILTWTEYDADEIDDMAKSKAEEELAKSAEAAEKQVKAFAAQDAEPDFIVFVSGSPGLNEEGILELDRGDSDYGICLVDADVAAAG